LNSNKKGALTLIANGETLPLDPTKTLLENLESQAVPIEFHCRDGHCGACRCTLLSGEVQSINSPMVYLREKEILACSSIANKNISISF
jgi:ferredoxin